MSQHFLSPNREFSTLIELLRWRALRQPEQRAYTFLLDGEVETGYLTYGELDCRARSIAVALQSCGAGGERALLLYPPGLEYIAAFFGCLYAGVVAVPAYPPQFNRPMPRLQAIVADAQATVALTTTQSLSNASRQFAHVPDLKTLRWLATDNLTGDLEDNWQEPAVTNDTLAFLQYTSGSTAAPKGVMVSHGNLLHNQQLIQKAFEHTEQSTVVGWLPLFHDMGLIGNMLQPLYVGIGCILMSPIAFLQRPLRWLQAISRYKATTSGGPNFAYDLCVRKITPEQRAILDLSSWEVAFNGAEPLRAETLDRFAAAFEPCGFRRKAFYPCYGMAETTLIVSGGITAAAPVLQTVEGAALEQNRVVPACGENDGTQTLVGCGQPLQDMQIVIAHPETFTRCLPDEVGEIWVAGSSVTQGYWNRTEETERIFNAYLSDTGEGPFLRTGDLGFLKEGELFITGRLKDLIIIRGRNHYPQDIEWTVERSQLVLQPTCNAAFSLNVAGEERLGVAAEVKRSCLRNLDVEEVIAAIRQAVAENHELQVYAVLLLKTGSIPKTSSGKIQRHACRTGFLNGSLDVVGSSILEESYSVGSENSLTREALFARKPEDRQPLLESYLREQVARVLRIAPSHVKPEQSLSSLGLDSLMAVELKNSIETNLGGVLSVTGFLQGSSIAQLATELFAQLSTPDFTPRITLTPASEAKTEYSLSYGQRALYFLHQLAPESPAYNIVGVVRIRSELDVPALQRAFQTLVERHPSLRTTFDAPHGQPVGRVHEQIEVYFHEEDVSTWSESSLSQRLVEEAHCPFNLEQDSLLRVSLFTRSAREHTLLLTVHHIVTDFWSLAVLVDELGMLYQASKNGTQASLTPPALQYADYVCWQTEMLASPEGEKLWAYWREKLAGELPILNLPTDRPRPPVQTYRGASHPFKLSAELTDRIKTLSCARGTTLYMTLLATFQVLLYRYSGQEDILVGSPTTGRSRAALAGLVGYLVNPVVLRANLAGNPTFEEFLSQVRQTVLDAFEHQDYPFALLVDRLVPVRDPSRSPLFQVMFVLQKAHLPERESLAAFALGETGARMKLGELELESFALEQRVAQFDLTLTIAEVDGVLSASWQYNTDLFDAATIARMAEHFQTLLFGAIPNPQQPISTLPLLTDAERHQLLIEFNHNQSQIPNPKSKTEQCIHQVFEAQVERTPNAVAVVFEDEQLTYRQLNCRANQVAHHLQKLGVGPEVLVGICMERSLEMVVGILAILKAGGAYVPLDPTYPQERLAFMLEDSQVPVLLTQEQLLETIPENRASVVCLNKGFEVFAAESEENPVSNVTAVHLAYVIYTSGSTGKPKGVLVNHHNVVRLFAATSEWFHFSDRDVWTLFHSYAFDFSVWEIWGALLYGGRLVVVPYLITRSPDAFYNLLCTEQVTVLNQTPSAFRQLIRAEEEALSNTGTLALRLVIFGGEALELKSLQPWFERHGDRSVQLVNMYGITETTVHVTYRPLTISDLSSATSVIGRPIPDLQVYILDRHQQPVPVGVPGEMYVGGAGVARGYLNRPELAAERFILNPYQEVGKQDVHSARLYKTGDLARYLPNGDIEYLGRIDDQVKIRGFRIELGEIEAALHQHPNVREAIVLIPEAESGEKSWAVNPVTDEDTAPITELRRFLKAKLPVSENKPADKRLVAYFVPRQQPVPTITELRRFLKTQLPEYMIPSTFVMLDALPLTPNGKVDRRSLPASGEARPDLEKAFVAPRNPVEEALAQIWSQVLGIEQVGIHDNFFELGGDSIRSIQVRARANERGLNFSLGQLFQHQTIDKLAQELTVTQPGALSTPKTEKFSLISDTDRKKLPEGVEDAYPLARIQAGVIFHSQSSPDSPMYHDIFLYHLRVYFDEKLLQKAVQQLVDRHPILRTSFDLTNLSEPLQLVHQTLSVPVQVEDMRSLEPGQQREALATWIEAEKSRHFDWSSPPMIRFFVHRLTDDTFYIVLSFHDCILDGWSTASLLTELLERYCTLLNGRIYPIQSPTTISYRDFVALERRTLQSEECRDYWSQKLKDCVINKLPRWHSYGWENDSPQIGVLNVEISAEVSDGLKKLAHLAQVPVKHVLLAAHLRVMSLLSGESDVLTGLESNGRLEEADGEQTLGIHLNTVPFRLQLIGGTWVELVQQVFATERELLPFRRYPYAELKKLNLSQHLFETVFNYTHFHVFQSLQSLKDLEILGAQGFGETHFALRVEFNREPASDRIQLDLECDLTKIGKAQLEASGSYYAETLTAMASQPSDRYESRCLLPSAQQLMVLVEWNDTATEYRQDWCIHQWFEAQVAQTPDATAAVFESQQLSYQELNNRANAIAHYLQSLGVGSDVLVVLCVERSLEMLVGILAILKAGGAYVPLDPVYPKEHLAFILEDTQAPVLLTQERLVAKLPKNKAQIVCLDSEWNVAARENPISKTTPENLAYAIYTSGSTGRPKGVLVTHQNLVHSTSARIAYYQEPVTSFLLVPSFAFDSSVAAIFWTLCQGGTLVLLKEDLQKDVWHLADAIAQHQVSHWLSVPSLYQALLAHIEPSQLVSLRSALVAGESCSKELVERHYQMLPHTSLFNEYGPTEATVWSSVYDCQNHDFKTAVLIGRPIANTQIYLLDSHLQPVPIGVPGELYIGGIGLAKGYLNRPELTAEKFIPNPFIKEKGKRKKEKEIGQEGNLLPSSERLYKTGDLARYLRDGNIEFLGRTDHQVKIRGYRIELTEIEAVLKQHPGVGEAVVITREEESGSKRLIAYVVPKQKPALTTDELRGFLKQKLPEYMIPNAFAMLDALPLTPNGKVDRQNLPAPETVESSDEKMARLLKRLEQLSDEEVKAMLSQKKLLTQQ